MGGKRRVSRIATKMSIEDEIAHLRGLDLSGLRARWRSVFGGSAALHLPRHLLFAIIAYRLQADRFGDLDHDTRQVLDRTGDEESDLATSARLLSFDQKRSELIPRLTDQNPCAHGRSPMDIIFQGRSTSVFQAKQQ